MSSVLQQLKDPENRVFPKGEDCQTEVALEVAFY